MPLRHLAPADYWLNETLASRFRNRDYYNQDFQLIRSTNENDFDSIIAIATASGLFEPDQTEMLVRMLHAPADIGGTDDAGKAEGSMGEVLLWNVKESKEHSRLKVPSSGAIGEGDTPIANIAFCPNGKLLAATDYEKTRVWNWVTQKVIATFHKKVDLEGIVDQSLAFSHDGKTFALYDRNEISIWKLP